MTKRKSFKLEFSEKQQCFHHTSFRLTEVEDWFTIYESCNDMEFHFFMCYVDRMKKTRLTKKYLMLCKDEVSKLILNMDEMGLYVSCIATEETIEHPCVLTE